MCIDTDIDTGTLILRALMEIDIDMIKAHSGGQGGLHPAHKR